MSRLAAPASGSIVCYNNSAAQIEKVLASAAHTPGLRLYLIDNSALGSVVDHLLAGGQAFADEAAAAGSPAAAHTPGNLDRAYNHAPASHQAREQANGQPLDDVRQGSHTLAAAAAAAAATPSMAALASRYGARYLRQSHNPGFGCAHNLAMRDAIDHGCRYHFVFNPDIQFGKDVLASLLDYMESHPDVAMLAPRVHYPDGRLQHLCKLLPTPFDLALRRLSPALHRLSGRTARYELHESGYEQIMDVPALSGCFMLMRSASLELTGLFDERFFLYFEDVDLSRRLRRVGRTVFYPYVHIEHDYTRGSYREWRLLWHHTVSAVRYFNKWGWIADPERRRINRACLRKLARLRTPQTESATQ